MSQVAQIRAADDRPPAKRRGGALANRDFAKLWAGESVSLLGTQVTTFTMPLIAVLTLNAPVFDVGVLFALRFIPVIVFSLFAGVWLDRRRRRPVMIACALGNAVLIGLVPVAAVTGWLSIGLLYLVTTLAGTLSMVFDVGALSYIPSLVDRQDLTDANSKIEASTAASGIVGPSLAGLLIGLITAPITLSVDAVSYLFAALGLITIRRPEPQPDIPTGSVSIRHSIAEGLHAVYGSKLLRALLTQGTALNMFVGSFIAVFVVYAVRVLGLKPFELSIVISAMGVGGLAGAVTANRVQQRIGLGRTLVLNTVGVSTALLLLLIPHDASLPAIAILVIAHLIYGWNIVALNVNTITLRQVVTPRRVLARMNASFRMLLFGSTPLGALLGGLLGSVLGLRSALTISVLAMTSPLLWLFFSPAFRLKQMPSAPDPDSQAVLGARERT
jgi:MFS family permease